MNQKPKKYNDDDGKVISDMNVDGMPWHVKKIRHQSYVPRKSAQSEQMTRSEAQQYTWYSLLAVLSIVLTFSLTWVLFTLFCTKIWFR